MAALINMAMLHRPYAFCRGPKTAPGSLSPFRLRRSTPFQLNLQRRLGHHFSPPFADASFLNAPQRSPSGAFFPLRLGSGGRRSAAARAGASDCAGFAPNKTQTRLSLTALSLAPCHLHKPPFSSFHRSVCFCPLALK